MHIEPGYLAPAKIVFANATALGIVAGYLRHIVLRPWELAKTLLAALFFSLFMQGFSQPVGPSELHFVGASAIYLTLGFVPTLVAFPLGLLVQGLLFDPADLGHLAVNALSLIVPLVAVHYTIGRTLFNEAAGRRLSWARLVKLDAAYYAGVTGMVGFWLFYGNGATAFADWALFAASYLAVVAVEPVLTLATVRLLKHHEQRPLVARLSMVRRLRLA